MSEQNDKAVKGPLKTIVGLIAFIVIMGGLLGIALQMSGSGASSSNNQSSSSAGDSSASAAASKPSPNTPRQPVVLLDLTGSGTKQTQKFTTASDWTLQWSYDCTAALGAQGNFIVTVYNADGSADYGDTDVNQLGTSGSDIQYYYDSGTHYLSINSECSWRVTAKG